MSAPIVDRPAFILAHTRLLAPPLAPEIQLQLADEATELWQKTEDELGEIGLPPPFWAFAWAGGQGLARHILDHPDLVAGRRVLDFASGSGLVAIAAAKAGACAVEASEIDEFALAAIALNATQNNVSLSVRAGDLVGRDEGWDVVLAGDVSYQQDMAEAVTLWLGALARRGAQVLIGDPWRSYLARDLLEPIAEYSVPTTRALEDSEIKRTGVFRFR
ncbi:methyltransferase [Methylocapsa sp. S129]|uniref:class I SAM-dependent methyltransferase n=1 Tax=Methylocapsa sp. S129 TaxID=1641869 RepID=UPI00131A7C61|nr:methyltransferase [Methylocapsa sp. S129]